MAELKHFILLLFIFNFYVNESSGLLGPSTLEIISVNETEVLISWTPVSYQNNVKAIGYHVRVTPIKSYSQRKGSMAMELNYPITSTQAHLRDLHAGTHYNISITVSLDNNTESAATMKDFRTEIGKPEEPAFVEILERNGKTMKIQLYPGESEKGPITGLQIIILEKTNIISFNEEQLFNQTMAEENGLPFYITAFLTASDIPDTFIVGDGKTYGGYYNAPLIEDLNYEVRVAVLSSLNGVTKAAFSPLGREELHEYAGDQIDDGSSLGMKKIIGISIGMSCFLLVALLLLYFLLRHHYAKRRLSDEMVLHDQIADPDENGFAAGALHIGEETNLGDFWELLKERFWTIPRELLEISDQIMGNGHFGEVRKGIVHKRGKPISVLVQFTQSESLMGDGERRALYSEIDCQLRLLTHPNVSEFVGICEDKGILHLIAEGFDSSLRGLLLRSRQQAGPKFCNVSEQFLLELALKIADGLKYISDHGVLHKRLSSRSIAIVDSYQPKITNFGLFFYHPTGKKLDYGRWLAPEASRSRTYTVKSDVWSFGVLLWEICTLGGTPFVDMPSQEVYPRAIRGLRLAHPTGVSDELFQLMLQCWELDADERPTFQELVSVLQNINLSASDHLRFDRIPGFQFHKFDPKGDEV